MRTARELHARLPQKMRRLQSRPALAEAGEDRLERRLDPQVGILPEPVPLADEADRRARIKLAALGLAPPPTLHAGAKNGQLGGGECALDAQYQAVVFAPGA